MGVQGRMVEVNDAAENGFLQMLGREVSQQVWIGITDNERFGGTESIGQPDKFVDGWVWSGPADTFGNFEARTLASTGYTNWNSGEPNGTTEDGVYVIYSSGVWNDITQNNSYRAVAEYEHAAVGQNFRVREVKKSGGNVSTVDEMRDLLNGNATTVGEATGDYAAVNFRDTNDSGGGNFSGHSPFPGDAAGDDNYFAVRARGRIVIPTAGDWTFAVGRDDVYELVVDRGADTAVAATGTCCGTTLTTVNFSSPGTYNITALFGEHGGGAYFEVSAAPGVKTAFDGDFKLVGDTVNGGLATVADIPDIGVYRGFHVRDVHSTGSVGGLNDVDNLLDNGLPGIASQSSGFYQVVNFHDSGGNGHFGQDNPFPDGGGDYSAVESTALLWVPEGSEGWWTFGVNSDDGFRLTIDDGTAVVPFSSAAGQAGTMLDNGSLVFPAGRGSDDSVGSILLAAGQYNLTLRYWEGTSGSTLELYYARGVHDDFNGAFALLGPIGVPEPSSFLLFSLGALGLVAFGRRRRRG